MLVFAHHRNVMSVSHQHWRWRWRHIRCGHAMLPPRCLLLLLITCLRFCVPSRAALACRRMQGLAAALEGTTGYPRVRHVRIDGSSDAGEGYMIVQPSCAMSLHHVAGLLLLTSCQQCVVALSKRISCCWLMPSATTSAIVCS